MDDNVFTYIKPEQRTTRQQFELDFGVYPPNSVTIDTPLEQHFTIRTFGFFSFVKIIAVSILKLLRNNPTNINKSQSYEFIETIKDSIKTTKDSVDRLKRELIKKPWWFFVFFIIIALASPLVIIFSVAVVTKTIVSLYLIQKRRYGFVHDFDHQNIYIRKDISNINNVDGIISHEHIHICQQSRSINPFQSHRLPSNFFRSVNDEAITKSMIAHLNYLHNTHELEARLHEIILSYYRHVDRLPQNYNSFIFALLCTCSIRASLSEDELRTIISC